MKDLLRSKLTLTCITLVVLAVFAAPMALTVVGAHAAPGLKNTFSASGNLDCNGFSKIQKPLRSPNACTDFKGYDGGRGFDNGHYIGHDEPSVQFVSNVGGSGNNTRWEITLPNERALPATKTFENQIAFWFSMALCDPNSFPQNPCIPDSDKNIGTFTPNAAGSAFLEMQFYPPGFSPFISQISCDRTHWCASLHINSLECNFNFAFCNPNCIEPTNFAFIQMDGIPTGPPGPASATNATFTPNAQTLLMNQGDKLSITIKDTPAGLINQIHDESTGKSGFMVASAANGFQSLNLNSCAPTNFTFHPEYATAKFGNFVPWAALQANVGFSSEIGHFTPGIHGDGDADDAPCFAGPTLPGCLDFATGGDIDFDGTSYLADWPDGTRNNATSLQISSGTHNGFGPLSAPRGSSDYTSGYPAFQFETDVLASESTCTPTGAGCTVPPPGAAFYPFYAQSGTGTTCNFTFGNDIRGATTNDFGRDTQYGTPNLPWFFGTASGGIQPNPCTPHGN
ncbi:MAG TPA: hypothetical protein VKP04_01940 [Ktedonobacteraceae bacterium]|nr:hypothetical protein [Ktedonobacteraceae bacterium]